MPDKDLINQEVRNLVASGFLGRSRSYVRLLEYLADCSGDDSAPKEFEIAAAVFGKGSDFDPNQDSLVRVYVHNLRQKLDNYYSRAEYADSERLVIPKGEYRLTFVSGAETAPAERVGLLPPVWAVALLVALIINIGVIFLVGRATTGTGIDAEISESPVWTSVMDDELPFLLVVGDYYIFAEIDRFGTVNRLVREFDINSADDLEARFVFEPELMESYLDLDLTYLPQSSASALTNVLGITYRTGKPIRVTPMSELSISDLRDSHVIYVGYISALGKLLNFVFKASGLELGDTYDELTNIETGETYLSGAGVPRGGQGNYTDYGMFSTFPGPGDNQIMIVAGTRDEGLMHTAQAIVDSEVLAVLETSLADPGRGEHALEVLYEVAGVDRTNLDAALVYSANLEFEGIWGAAL